MALPIWSKSAWANAPSPVRYSWTAAGFGGQVSIFGCRRYGSSVAGPKRTSSARFHGACASHQAARSATRPASSGAAQNAVAVATRSAVSTCRSR